ncbi:MAG: methylated-DNA--[protein]-cysteine S-methyltransferase [Acidobacteria bacterium]|jgi:methylated-DNA-[protein]-cysteine S-methyltransferase|nr:methylated-DNA--[protein]-cysteine S-methyltransferase [Acidobacteriota bacterium]
MAGACYHLFETDAGPCGLGWSAAGLTQVQLPEASAAETAARLARRSGGTKTDDLPPAIEACVQKMRAYFEGAETDFRDAQLDMRGLGDFQVRVYTALRETGWGEATSYGALAAAVGEPGAARAIGAAMGANPWPLIVPCHRVLAANGKIGGFSAHGGRATKRRMLQLERIDADGAAPELPGLFD